jgi:hypothetical protein
MSTFVFAVLAGFCIHQLATIIQPLTSKKSIQFRRFEFGPGVVLRIPDKTYLRVKLYVLVFLVVVFALAVAAILAQGVHPPEGYAFRAVDVIRSPQIGAAFFGSLVGILVGNLVNRIVRGKNYELKPRDRLEMFLIFILFILGIGAEELIQSYARRISKISIGATSEISFTEGPSKSGRASAEQPGNAAQRAGGVKSADYLPESGSTALDNLSNLSSTVKADRQYLHALLKYEDRKAGFSQVYAAHDSFGTFSENLISPVTSCIGGLFARTADQISLKNDFTSLADKFRRIAEIDADKRLSEAISLLASEPFDLAKEFRKRGGLALLKSGKKLNEDEANFVKSCGPLMASLCLDSENWVYDNPEWFKERQDSLYYCMDNITNESDLAKTYPNTYRTLLELTIKSLKDSDPLPYFAMTRAGLFAQLGYYDAAALALHNWINKEDPKDSRKKLDLPTTWYVMRARVTLGIYIEEWIRSRGDTTPLALRQYHIDNLARVIAGMKELKGVAHVEKMSDDYTLTVGTLGAFQRGDDGICPLAEDEQASLGKLFETYVSALTTFIDNALKHPIFSRTNATIIAGHAQQLRKISLKCVASDAREEARAEMLDRYVRNHINLAVNTAALKGSDAVRQQLREAGHILRLAIQLIDRKQKQDRATKEQESDFRKQIATSNVIELYESLLATQGRLQEVDRDNP